MLDAHPDLGHSVNDQPPPFVLGIGGTPVPMRPEQLTGLAGKRADGSARTREASLIVISTAVERHGEGRAIFDADSVTSSAAIDSATARDNRSRAGFARRG